MSPGEVADNTPDLPSTIGEGWLQVSVDDPVRDRRLIINNLMRELCLADQQTRQNQGTTAELTIEDVWSLQAFEPNYVQTFLREFESEKHYIQMNSTGHIRLTDTGREHCSSFTRSSYTSHSYTLPK